MAEHELSKIVDVEGEVFNIRDSTKQPVVDRVTAWGSTPSDTKYPSEKLVKDSLDGKASSSHTHGNIQNGGTLQTTDVTIANGDKLVVTDASDSNKIARTSVSFDGSTTTKALTPKGTFETIKEADVGWGGSFSTALSPIEFGNMARNLVHNPLPSAIKYERSNDGGTTWTTQQMSDANKLALFNAASGSSSVGIPNSSYSGITDPSLLRGRITLYAVSSGDITAYENTWCYGQVKRILMYVARSGDGKCLVELQSGPHLLAKDNVWSVQGTYDVAGDSGWNSIPLDTTFGGYSNQLGGGRYVAIRFTFWVQSGSTPRISIIRIGLLPEISWVSRASAISVLGVPISINDDGTGYISESGKLSTSRKLAVSLSNTSTDTSFDGSADVTNIKTTGTLPVANGGTGQTSLANVTVGNATTATDYNTSTGTIKSALDGKVSTSTTVNGHALSGNVTVTAADVSAVRYDTASQGLTDTQKSNARTNIGAGTSNLALGTSSTTAAKGDHAHGNIQNGGTLQTNDVTIASGDKLVVTDSSDSSKVARTSVSFDGSTTTTALTPKGTFESFAKAADITTAIQALDVSSVGGAGKYISAISEADGKISATATSMDTTPTASSTNAVTSGGVKAAIDAAVSSALQAAIEYVTTSSTWQTLETAYNAGKTLVLKVENGTNWFDEYRLTAVNKSSGSDRFIFCGFPTMVNLEGGSVESLEVTEWICYFDGSTTRWTTTTVDGLELPTKGYVDGKLPASGTTPITKTYAINITGNAATATTVNNLAAVEIEATSSSTVDLNSYNTTSSALGNIGLRVFNWGASSAPYISNSPFDASGILYVGGFGSGFTNQWAINRTTGDIYYRYCEYNATNWLGWKKLTNLGQVGTSTKPVFINSNGAAQACDFSVNFGTPVSGANVLNIITA